MRLGWLPLLLLAALAACHPPRAVRPIPPGSWPATLGGPARAPFATESAPEAPRRVWQRGQERGLASAPVVHGDLVIVGATGRALVTSSARTGERYWLRRLRAPIVGPALRVDDVLIAAQASRDGRVLAAHVERGRKRWETRLRSGIVGEPLHHEGRLYIATANGEIAVLDVRNGAVRARLRTPGAVAGAFVVHEGAVLAGTVRDSLVRIPLAEGEAGRAVALPGTPSAALAIAGTRLLVPVHGGAVASYDARTLELLAVDSVGAPVLAAPVVDADGAAYLLTRDGEVWRWTVAGASRLAALGGGARESLTLAHNGLLIGRLDGTLILLRKDGTEVWREQFGSSLRAPVTLAGGALYVALANGQLVKLQ